MMKLNALPQAEVVGEIVQVFLYVRRGKVAGVAHALVRESAELHDLFGQVRPQAFVHAGVDRQAVLVPVDVVRVHPRATNAVGLFERHAIELRALRAEVLEGRQTGSPASDYGHRLLVRPFGAARRHACCQYTRRTDLCYDCYRGSGPTKP